MKNLKILSICGVFGAIAYLIFILIASSLFPGYSHASEYVSNLGAVGQPSALVMNIGFIVTGSLIMLFGLSTLTSFKKDWKGTVGGIIIMFEGLAQILSGVFSCEPGCNATDPTMAESIHNIVGPLGFILIILAAFFWAFRFRKQDSWDSFWIYTLVTGIAALILFVIFGMSVGTPIVGIWQRLLRITLYLWVAIFSYRLWANWELSPFRTD